MTGTTVGCHLVFEVEEPATLVLQLAVASSAGQLLEERFGGAHVEELPTGAGGRMHLVRAQPGTLDIRYDATVVPAAEPPPQRTQLDEEAVVALRQSRYCPSDQLAGFAAGTFGSPAPTPDLGREIASWVHGRIRYQPGASGPADSAVDTLLSGEGVCRDFAHLTIALCRALELPARLVSVYAPGLSPMDFHAVVEVRGEDGWELVDATCLAPRHSLVRIATGRDAADTAFATTMQGRVQLVVAEITAASAGDLPIDDHSGVVRLP